MVSKIKDDFEQPYWDKFNKITLNYFENKGNNVIINNKNKSDYIQIRGAEWDYHVHYEWCPITFESLFFNQEELSLCIHIEGNDFKHAQDQLRENIPLNPAEGITHVSYNRGVCFSIEKNENFEDRLTNAYNKVLQYWEMLSEIGKQLTNRQQNESEK